jgi:hypothetical protein
VGSVDRPRRRRVSLELVVLGLACVACCLPLLGAMVAGGAGLLTALAAAAAGINLGVAVFTGFAAAAIVVLVWRLSHRPAAKCPTCGASSCGC